MSILNYRQPFLFAVAFHLILLAVILFQLHSLPDAPAALPVPQTIIQATLVMPVTADEIKAEPSPPKPQIESIQSIEEPPLLDEKKSLEEPKKLQSLPQENTPIEKIQPKTHVDTVELQKEATLALEKIKQQQAKENAKKKAAIQKQKRLQAAIKEQVETEQSEKKVKSALKQEKTIEQLLQQDLAKSSSTKLSKKSDSTAKSTPQFDSKEMDRYKGLVIAAISRRWIMPENLKKGLEAHLKVRLAPGGVVLSVNVIQSSGDSTLDRSAESAIYKASPLPVPKESNLFGQFREFNLVVRPEGILTE